MKQLHLFNEVTVHRAPNVASVPQYSPLRYPGGKTWLYPFAKKWLFHKKDRILIEPFAGGASVGLAAAIEDCVQHVILVEKDEDVAAFWKTVVSEDAEWLAKKIINFKLTDSNIDAVLSNKNKDLKNKAFALLLCNRINHGGILANGSGRLAYGENGKGIRSRWYPSTLQQRILRIAQYKDKIQVIHGDGFEIMNQNITDTNVMFFIDPPYTKAGRRLYTYFEVDHKNIFHIANECLGEVLITYDYADEIVDYARNYGFTTEKVLMKTTHHLKKYELLISKDLSWL